MVFVRDSMPARQVGLTHLPNIFMKKTTWRNMIQTKITETVKKDLEKMREEHEKR
jgi:hypothetical protein